MLSMTMLWGLEFHSYALRVFFFKCELWRTSKNHLKLNNGYCYIVKCLKMVKTSTTALWTREVMLPCRRDATNTFIDINVYFYRMIDQIIDRFFRGIRFRLSIIFFRTWKDETTPHIICVQFICHSLRVLFCL